MRGRFVRVLVGIVGLLLLIYVGLSLLAQPVPDHPFFGQDGVLVIAHQGGEGLRPSNTLASFSHAVDLGVDVLEMDIHTTADNILVVMHDDTVDRTTDGSGRIQELTLEQLKTLDAGDYWTDDQGATYPFRGQGIQVPTLEEIFTAFPDMPMNIEIKQESPSMVVPFCQLLEAYQMKEQVLVASFHESTMKEFRSECPGVATSMVEPEIRLLFVLNTLFLGRLFQAPSEAIQVPEYFGDLHVITDRFVKATQSHNVDLHVWTVNETEDLQRMLDFGVDGIITDRPDRLLELLDR